jgi:hypothetical protein
MYQNKEFVHQVGKKDFHYIRMYGQQKKQKLRKDIYIVEFGRMKTVVV